MNKYFKLFPAAFVAVLLFVSCNSNNPHRRGIVAGQEACQCYQLHGLDSVVSCLDRIDRENHEFLNDTAYTNAMEQQMLECISDGVIDITKPIK